MIRRRKWLMTARRAADHRASRSLAGVPGVPDGWAEGGIHELDIAQYVVTAAPEPQNKSPRLGLKNDIGFGANVTAGIYSLSIGDRELQVVDIAATAASDVDNDLPFGDA